VVDDRRSPVGPLDLGRRARLLSGVPLRVLTGAGRGPAQARNVGWRAASTPWVAFLDDDVVPTYRWPRDLVADLDALAGDVAGVQGRIVVPLPVTRRASDAERGVAGLETARWATADLAYRRSVLAQLGGFDERFPRAYREDAELALRVMDAGWRLERGRRTSIHPTRQGRWWASVERQAGNADDALMRRLHGPDWHRRAGAPRGRRATHLATTALGALALLGGLCGRTRLAAGTGLGWAALTGRFAAHRLAPGPADLAEAAALVATSAAIPPAASLAWLVGLVRARRLVPASAAAPARAAAPPANTAAAPVTTTPPATTGPSPPPPARAAPPGLASRPRVGAVAFDRDGTLVVDVPYNADPELVAPVPGARQALDRLRAAGLRLAVVSNQSGVGRGLISLDRLAAVNRRLDELLGPFDAILVCPHSEAAACACRKPQPAMVREAARRLGSPPEECLLVGDIGSDIEAARRAGAPAVLVPTDVTRAAEVAAAPWVAADLNEVVDAVLDGRDRTPPGVSARPGRAGAPRGRAWWRPSR
jgi:HAD superfamily hydrolase (TIGR01662 family)